MSEGSCSSDSRSPSLILNTNCILRYNREEYYYRSSIADTVLKSAGSTPPSGYRIKIGWFDSSSLRLKLQLLSDTL